MEVRARARALVGWLGGVAVFSRKTGLAGTFLVSVLLGSAGSAAAAQTTFLWSPIKVDPGGALTGVACPTESRCVAVDSTGREVTFQPSSATNPTPVPIAAGKRLGAVACPSALQCTALDANGGEITFDPASPKGVTAAAIDNGQPQALSCPLMTQCTVVDDGGNEVTFNPASPGHPTPVPIGNGERLYGISCPSATQCTAVGGRDQVTFNPTSPAGATPAHIVGELNALGRVACPTLSQCTAVWSHGGAVYAVAFNPTAPANPSFPLTSADGYPTGLACPSTTQCTATYFPSSPPAANQYNQNEISFDPTASGYQLASIVPTGSGLTGVACPSIAQCVLIDDSGDAWVGLPILATTLAVSPSGTASATLRGIIETAHSRVTWQFQFGTTTKYKKTTPVRTIGAGHGRVRVSWRLINLRKLRRNTLYHVRLVAHITSTTGSTVTVYGNDRTFIIRPTGKRRRMRS
jgi:hypothetical protein